jgi:hypothetical protein
MMPAGYSGTPLAKKLGFTADAAVFQHAMPRAIKTEILRVAPAIRFLREPAAHLGMGHIFVIRASELATWLRRLRPMLADTGMLWISWPKRASKVETDITEDRIRDLALPLGLVDVKVCAVDETWSGLKLMIRRSERSKREATKKASR